MIVNKCVRDALLHVLKRSYFEKVKENAEF